VEASALQAAQAHRFRISLSGPLLRLRSDEQLVALFRDGSEEAFGVIHDRYRVRLLAYMRQMLGGSRADAEDALQDVFLRAYGALRGNDNEIALKAWLYRVAHNRCIDVLRRPTPAPADVFDVSRGPLADPTAETERREDLRRLIADVRRLPEQQRSVLLMREMEGLSYAELADAHDVTVPAVKSLLVRARIGLVQAAEARDTACDEVRGDLATAHGRGVRANARARRHLRDCDACQDYRTQLRARRRQLAALSPGPGPLALLAQLFGGSAAAGGGGAVASGAVAGGSAAAGGGALLGGGLAATSATKMAIAVGAAVATAGGAVEVEQGLTRPVQSVAPQAASAPPVVAHAHPRSDAPVVAVLKAARASTTTAPAAARRGPAAPERRAAAPARPDETAPPVRPPSEVVAEHAVVAPAPAPVPTTTSTSTPVGVADASKMGGPAATTPSTAAASTPSASVPAATPSAEGSGTTGAGAPASTPGADRAGAAPGEPATGSPGAVATEEGGTPPPGTPSTR